jgi:hypothetical protein
MLLIIWLIVWLAKGHPTIVWPSDDWAISLYICAALSLWPRQYGLRR